MCPLQNVLFEVEVPMKGYKNEYSSNRWLTLTVRGSTLPVRI